MESNLKISNPLKRVDIIEMAENLAEILVDDMKLEMFGLKLLRDTSSKKLRFILLAKKPTAEKCKEILEMWVNTTAESECQWEQVRDALREMDFERLASQMTTALNRDDQLNGGASISLSQQSEASCRTFKVSGVIRNMDSLTVWEKGQVECIDLLYTHAAEEYEYFRMKQYDLQYDESKDWLHFRTFMFDLYSVLDYTCFLLYCHFANGGALESDHKKASKCGFPYKTIKISESIDQKISQEKFYKDHLKFLFGSVDHVCKDAVIKSMYQIQPKKQVDIQGRDYEPRDMEKNLEDDEKSFTILHHFRNYSAHRSLVCFAAKPDELWTRTDVTKDLTIIVKEKIEREGFVYHPIGKGYWILLPDEKIGRPLLDVLLRLQIFVKKALIDILKAAFPD